MAAAGTAVAETAAAGMTTGEMAAAAGRPDAGTGWMAVVTEGTARTEDAVTETMNPGIPSLAAANRKGLALSLNPAAVPGRKGRAIATVPLQA
ncbi:hypothetical protein [Acetatifactor aquisgranensis]|uniref:hypothetical protein n=1 Tax=Acetatifactor aquisgranensis TaxID=2941233 RepID=UPI0020406C0C|nr:hypothetical protein [Acetatifactor aquisgranensis]